MERYVIRAYNLGPDCMALHYNNGDYELVYAPASPVMVAQ